MFPRGLKRKCMDAGEDGEGAPAGPRPPPHSLQRQSLLDMSLVKLQLCHMLVEPDLCRSVLIANTVRQIQEEMTQDGTWHVAAPQGAGFDRLISTEILCRATQQEGEWPTPGLGDAHPQGLVSEIPAGPSAQPPGSVWETDSPCQDRGSVQKSLGQIFDTLGHRHAGPMGELLPDLDGPYYDLDAVLTGMVGTPPGRGEALEGFAPAPGPGCKAELGELDHVVEILVET
ncbi:cell division cycle-associated protein 4 isoform X2 [Tupaia chinensis]|nr:cell division cycle-associated protein 4 isoform X2 [Tupaia chinensis]